MSTPPGLGKSAQEGPVDQVANGMRQVKLGADGEQPVPAGQAPATPVNLLQQLIQQSSASRAAGGDSRVEHGAQMDRPGSGHSAAVPGSNMDLLAQLLAGQQPNGAPSRGHTPPPGIPSPLHRPIVQDDQQVGPTQPHLQQQVTTQRDVPGSPQPSAGRHQMPGELNPMGSPAGEPRPNSAQPSAAQVHTPAGASGAAGSNLLALLQQQGAGGGDPTHLPAHLQGQQQLQGEGGGSSTQLPAHLQGQQPPHQAGLQGPAATQRLQQHIAELVQRAVPGLPYKLEPWQVRVAPGGMAAEVMGLPHQPQASFRVPEPVIAEAHHRLQADQMTPSAQVGRQALCGVPMYHSRAQSRKSNAWTTTVTGA